MDRKKIRHDLLLHSIKGISILFTVGLFIGTLILYCPLERSLLLLISAAYTVMFFLFVKIYDSLSISVSKLSDLIYSQLLAVFLSDICGYVLLSLAVEKAADVLTVMLCFLCQIVFAAVWSVCSRKLYFTLFKAKKTLVIGNDPSAMKKLISENGLDNKFDVVRTMCVSECMNESFTLEGIEAVFLTDIHSHERNCILKKCVAENVSAYIVPRIGDILMSSAETIHMLHLPMAYVGDHEPTIEYMFLKRLTDIVFSAVMLLLLSPMMLIVSICIKATDGGPVFYRQQRLTYNGKVFSMMKFRSMRIDAEKDGIARLSTGTCDERITRIGRFIRRFHIDETPQLVNILRGEMSLIGPRPERPEIAAQYEESMPEFRLRLRVRAGLTGYAQVYGKYNTNPYDKLKMDLLYIANRSIKNDLNILLATVKVLLQSESTDGVEVGHITADNDRTSTCKGQQI